jgi:hypothetical protein
MELHAFADGTTFGWNSTYTDMVENAILNGKVCASGFAYNSAGNVAMCAAMNLIQEGTSGTPNSAVAAPFSCNYTATNRRCMYYYTGALFYETPCRCGLDGNGYCPYPAGQDATNRILAEKVVLKFSRCHTMDRYNYAA